MSDSCGEEILALFWCTQLLWEPWEGLQEGSCSPQLARNSGDSGTVENYSGDCSLAFSKKLSRHHFATELRHCLWPKLLFCNLRIAWIVIFSYFSTLRCDYGNVLILNIRVAKEMGGIWPLNWARRKEAEWALWDVTCTGNLPSILCLNYLVITRTCIPH